MSGDRDVAGDDECRDQDDYESDGGADDWYNDGHDGGSYSKDDFGGVVIFWIGYFAMMVMVIIKSFPEK